MSRDAEQGDEAEAYARQRRQRQHHDEAVLACAAAAQLALQELGGSTRGRLAVAASQTLASYWLPPLLMRFAAAHFAIELTLAEGNTSTVAAAVLEGTADVGLIEGAIDEPALAVNAVAEDRLVVVAAPTHSLADRRQVGAVTLAGCRWVMREAGSATRGAFEAAMRDGGIDPDTLKVVLALPTNEAVCAAVADVTGLTVVSELVARAHVEAARLRVIDHHLPVRRFTMLRHKERYRTKAALAFESLLGEAARAIRRPAAASDDI